MEQNNNQFQPPIHQPNQQQTPPQPPFRATVAPMPQRKTKNKFWAFCWALIPGAGQMNFGLMKKGISLMLIFWGIIAASVLLYAPVLNFLLPVVWFYSFFDAMNNISTPIDELKLLKDDFIFNVPMPKIASLESLMKKRHILIGWGIATIGIYALLRMLLESTLILLEQSGWQINDGFYWMTRNIIHSIPSLIIPIICIIIGVKLIKGSVEKRKSPSCDEAKTEEIL